MCCGGNRENSSELITVLETYQPNTPAVKIKEIISTLKEETETIFFSPLKELPNISLTELRIDSSIKEEIVDEEKKKPDHVQVQGQGLQVGDVEKRKNITGLQLC